MKTAKVIPVFRKGHSDMPSNCRPILLLSIFNKLFEKIVCTRITNFLIQNDILYDYQFGFRKFHSTNLAVIDVIDNILEHLDARSWLWCWYLHWFAKSLWHCKPCTIGWKFILPIDNSTGLQDVCSSSLCVTCGVPQGSVLGPLLFMAVCVADADIIFLPFGYFYLFHFLA